VDETYVLREVLATLLWAVSQLGDESPWKTAFAKAAKKISRYLGRHRLSLVRTRPRPEATGRP
jgi:hypothetical protein